MTLTSPKLKERAILEGDEVISVAAGFPTTINPIIQFGAIPVFVDVDKLTHNIDASKIEAAIGPRTKAIMLAHSLGNPFNLDLVETLAKKHNLWVVEDSCDALGGTYRGKTLGTFGDLWLSDNRHVVRPNLRVFFSAIGNFYSKMLREHIGEL